MRRYPSWLKHAFSPDGTAREVRSLVGDLALETVCERAVCPNLRECWSQRQLTFMILGERCTRSCRFCAVEQAKPQAVSEDEPWRVAEAVNRLGLKHAVITSVARDDLQDEGAGHFARVIDAVRSRNPGVTVEVLVPDFHGRDALVRQVMDARPEVFAHNIETVERLTPVVRVQAQYRRSLDVLRLGRAASAARHFLASDDRAGSVAARSSIIKSSLMLGLGERVEELQQAFDDLLAAGCTHLTLGQYLRPSPMHLPIVEYLSPERFADYERMAYAAGFQWVKAGPFVRSSYHAIDALN